MHIRSVAIDGSGDGRVTPMGTQAFEPDWSPDGARIAFVTIGENDIVLINPDGSGLLNLTNGVAEDDSPTWSPDGSKLAFNTGSLSEPLESEVAVMNPDGTGRASLSNLTGFDFGPSWSPDGSGLVFTSTVDGNSEIYVMNADGSGQKNLSQHPDAEDTESDWSGRAADGSRTSGAHTLMRRWQLELCTGSTRCGRQGT
jgi:Tol biopolymer transport system component